MSAGKKFRQALADNKPLQIVGTINAYSAMMAKAIGHQAIYLSGGGVANASYGLPDLGMTTMNDVLEDVRRISAATDVPLLVDIDTGWGGAFNIGRTVKEMIRAGAAALRCCGYAWPLLSPLRVLVLTDRRRSSRSRRVSRSC